MHTLSSPIISLTALSLTSLVFALLAVLDRRQAYSAQSRLADQECRSLIFHSLICASASVFFFFVTVIFAIMVFSRNPWLIF